MEEGLERETGIEPATNGLGSRDSTTELLPLNKGACLREIPKEIPHCVRAFAGQLRRVAKRLKLLPLTADQQSLTPCNYARNFGLRCMDPTPQGRRLEGHV